MRVRIHPYAAERMEERGATKREVMETVKEGESFQAKFGRTGFRRNFSFEQEWRGKIYGTKQVEIYGVKERNSFLVLTVVTKYF